MILFIFSLTTLTCFTLLMETSTILPLIPIVLCTLCLNFPLNNWLNCSSMESWLTMTSVSFILSALSLLILSFMLMTTFHQAYFISSKLFNQLMLILGLFMIMTFTVSSIMAFYIFFEASLLPIFIIVMGWGYQPERLTASLSMMIYTLFASLPLLYYIISLNISVGAFLFMAELNYCANMSSMFSVINHILIMAAFLVKIPMYFTHLWLPKAHVEAPVIGSMVLAAILLKMGGYGLIQFSPLILFNSSVHLLIMSISLLGGSMTAVLCVVQMDLKVLIAYSSVAHMSFVIGSILTKSYYGMCGALMMMVAHGICSSGLFSGANIMYLRSSSRNLMLNKGVLNYIPSFSLWWFLLCMGNMGSPPTINLLSEIICVISLLNMASLFMGSIMICLFFSVVFTLILYSGTQQGKPFKFSLKTSPLTILENMVLFGHVWGIIIFIVSMHMWT